MTSLLFPPVENADSDGLLALGGPLNAEVLIEAYSSGIFPWPFQEKLLAWFAPPKRAVLFFENLHISESFQRFIKKNELTIKVNTCFTEVMQECAKSKNRTGQKGTWITSSMIKAYTDLHKGGFAHSVEAFAGKELVGGIYGVCIGSMFAGESMFYKVPNASKLTLYYLIQILKHQGANWLDCQVITANLKRFGATELKRGKFMELLSESLRLPQIEFNEGLLSLVR